MGTEAKRTSEDKGKYTKNFVQQSLILLTILQENAGLGQYEQYRITDTTVIPEPDPIMEISGETIAVASDIFAISGAAKAGKSAFMSMAIAASLTHTGTIEDGIEGLKMKPNPDGLAVVHIDTEQAKHKQQKNVQKILNRAQFLKTPPYFLSYNIRKLELNEYEPLTTGICIEANQQFNGIHSIWIDGGADYITGVNEEQPANAIVKYFESLAITYSTAVFIIVHTNPGSDKERGHFGSQLQRKAGGILIVKEDAQTGYSYIEPKILRYAGKGNIKPMGFKYDLSKGYHVGIGVLDKPNSAEAKHRKEMNLAFEYGQKVFASQNAFTYSEAIEQIGIVSGKSISINKSHFAQMNNAKMILKGDDNRYRWSPLYIHNTHV